MLPSHTGSFLCLLPGFFLSRLASLIGQTNARLVASEHALNAQGRLLRQRKPHLNNQTQPTPCEYARGDDQVLGETEQGSTVFIAKVKQVEAEGRSTRHTPGP